VDLTRQDLPDFETDLLGEADGAVHV
jgi:hypothetical protein